jgi:cytosine/adenosine deaminase-related metal-dependent hydrolase
MPFITAGRIHDGQRWLPSGTTIELSADGTVISLHAEPNEETITYGGILTPGFVNVHCHLELSHMKGLVPEHTSLIPFLKTIPQHRNDFTDEQKREARHNAYAELVANGVVALGDIANTTDTLDVRALDKLHVQTFVEALGFNEANAQRSFDWSMRSYADFKVQSAKQKTLRQAIVPHAPYSVSSALFKLIATFGENKLSCIHNQESPEENKYFLSKEGHVRDLLSALGIDDSSFVPSGKTSLQTYLNWMSADKPIIFVHNTYSTAQDIEFARNYLSQSYWCLCPNANLYIENHLPDIDMLIGEGLAICIGTDSLASNHQLSVLAELQTIRRHYPHVDWETLLTWATANGARALQMQDIVGTISPGKQPGILRLNGLDTGSPIVERLY